MADNKDSPQSERQVVKRQIWILVAMAAALAAVAYVDHLRGAFP